MLCDVCGKNQATVHLTEIVDDQMTELHLCEGCAKNKSAAMEQQFGLGDLLGGMADYGKTPVKEEGAAAALKCPNCGMTYADFKKIGRLGCSECYPTFRKYLIPLLKRIHGSTQHAGKSPVFKAPQKVTRKKAEPAAAASEDDLRFRLQRAIEAEEFEEAARLRDRIKEMEKK